MQYKPLITNGDPYRADIWIGKDCSTHWHGELEVLCCIEGSIQVRVEDRQYPLTEGHTLVIPSNEAHSFIKENDHTRVLVLKFGYPLLGSDFTRIQNSCMFFSAANRPEQISASLSSLINCLQTDQKITSENEWKIRGHIILLAYGLRNTASTYRPSENQIYRTRRLMGIYPALDYVKKHYREPITLDDAANLTGYAKTYFCKYFKRVTGISFHQYLNRYRITVACMLLEDISLSVVAIAEMTGFSSAKLFCRIFKETTNMTTSQYQRLSPEEKSAIWGS